jgi:hypothetical protein
MSKKGLIQIHVDSFMAFSLLDMVYIEMKEGLSKETKSLIKAYYENKKEFNYKYEYLPIGSYTKLTSPFIIGRKERN